MWGVWPVQLSTPFFQVNVPRNLPFSVVGQVKQAACGGTGCVLLNGEGLGGCYPHGGR